MKSGSNEVDIFRTGLVVPSENTQAATYAIEKLVFNPELRMQMGEAGRKHVAETYGWDVCVQTMVKVFKSTIKQ